MVVGGCSPLRGVIIVCFRLTVEEHLLFFGQLKGLSRKEVKDQTPE